MKATGLFFLTGRPSLAHAMSPDEGDVILWQLPLVERTRRGVQKVTAYWRGTDAALFVQIHADRLKSGQALNLELERVRPVLNELTAHVTACSLAPDRWPVTSAPLASQAQQQATNPHSASAH